MERIPLPTETPWPTGLTAGEVRAINDIAMTGVEFFGMLFYVLLALSLTLGVFWVVRD